jgi:hypothetical protein
MGSWHSTQPLPTPSSGTVGVVAHAGRDGVGSAEPPDAEAEHLDGYGSTHSTHTRQYDALKSRACS